MVLQPRDEDILRVCYEQQFLTMDHILKFFFHGKSRSEPYRRIRELEKEGLIKREAVALFPGTKLIRLTRKGLDLAQSLSPFSFHYLHSVNLAQLEHDAILTSVRLRLGQLWDGLWNPESHYRARAKEIKDFVVPDGVVQFFEDKQPYAIELENSIKANDRLKKRLIDWSKSRGISILYIATSQRIENFLKSQIEKNSKEGPFLVVNWDELETGKPQAWSTSGPKDIFNTGNSDEEAHTEQNQQEGRIQG